MGNAPKDFDLAYFRAGPLRDRSSLTQSVYERLVFRWLERIRPEVLRGDGKTALEIGCGLGFTAELIARRGYDVLATDISGEAIESVRSRGPSSSSTRFEVWDASTPPPFAARFDLVVALEVIEHISAYRNALQTWADLVKPGGALVMTTPNAWSPLGRYWRDPTHVSVKSPNVWRREMLPLASWESLQSSTAQFVPYTWRLDGVMRIFPLPVMGASFRLLAVKNGPSRA